MAETSAAGAERQGSEREVFPEILQLHGSDHPGMILRSITSLAQGNLSLADYYTKLKMLWDELIELKPTPQCTCHGCTCGATQAIAESSLSAQLLQFLMGLSEEFDNKMWHCTHEVKQEESLKESQERNHLKTEEVNIVITVRGLDTRETCFKLHGTPDWYKELNEQRKKQPTTRGLMVETTERRHAVGQPETKDQTLLQELMKLIKGSLHQEEQVNFAQTDDFAGEHFAFASYEKSVLDFWIVDTGATNHMCANPKLLHNISTLSHPTYVHLPDGSSQKVQESNITLAIGKLMENLYIIDKSSFCPEQQYPPSDNVPLPLIPLTADTISPTPCRPSSPIDPSTNSPPESPPSPAHSISLRRSTRQIPNLVGLLIMNEPRTYSQACKNPHWVEAMEKELYALENNETWELTTLPRDKKAIGSKWVFKLKMNPDGSVERYKARLVAKGYNQIEGVDYFDSFSPVAKTVTVRVLLAVATVKSWPLFQLDVNNAFLHGHLEEDVYMTPPEGYTKAQSGQVCKLKRSLYGLKQASRQWNLELTTKLLEFGFQQSSHDHCLFIKHSDSSFLALLVYVDDILLTGSSTTDIDVVKTYLDRLFTIKDLGPAKYFLGLQLARSDHGLLVTQTKYLTDILEDQHDRCQTYFNTASTGIQVLS
ncbi:Retrovirus-related Pol polyprotein from transposon RE1 [Sesamum angolense]|uniref:Retrovirus-related Pol polyprotein from transposon RE1 n=1 Tax=Sesamum angolense TaxID=2727404 RepID=A0AAE1W642_9LAMI|nr:Retrovirus-related Pol polyprotein from transposon RE1 [Sesamum angolense]